MKSMLFMVKLLLVVGLCSSIAFSQHNFTTALYGMNNAEGYLVRQTLDGQPAIDVPGSEVLLNLKLEQNVPNPFFLETMLHSWIPNPGHVSLPIYYLSGRLGTNLVNGYKSAGSYSVLFNGNGLRAGVYSYQLQSGTFEEQRNSYFDPINS